MSSARRIVLACLSVLLFLSSAPPARAGWGWLEKLSGPGPFEGFETPTVPVWCFDAERRMSGFLCQGYQDQRERTVFLSFTFANLNSRRNELEYPDAVSRAPEVNLKSYQFSFDIKLHAGLDLGVGLGLNRFSGGQAFNSFTKYSVEPFRVVWRPIGLLFPDKAYWGTGAIKWSLRDLVQVKFRGVMFPQGFQAGEFGAIGGLDEPSELLIGYSITFGVVAWW